MSGEVDLEDDLRYLQGHHQWTLRGQGVNQLRQEWQKYVCRVCGRGYVTIQAFLRPPDWTPLMPPEAPDCKPKR